MTSFEERAEIAEPIVRQKGNITGKLLNTYLSHYKYLTDSQMTVLQELYQQRLDLDSPTAARIQRAFTAVAYPFVYQGKFEDDVKKAGEYYRTIFDEPIQLAENSAVAQTVSTSISFQMDQLKSSIHDREDKDVKLVSRFIDAKLAENPNFALITIEEEYQNITSSEQEVFYIFSLPQESAVVDLKLGTDLNLKRKAVTVPTTVLTPQPKTKAPNPSACTHKRRDSPSYSQPKRCC